MKIDNYEEAKDLCDRLEATIPFQITAKKPLLKIIQDKGYPASTNTLFTVDWIEYFGEEGGITCGLWPPGDIDDIEERFVISLTHVEIDPEHPLAAEVQAYQQRRIRNIKLAEQGGFAAEFMTHKAPVKRKTTKGFGK